MPQLYPTSRSASGRMLPPLRRSVPTRHRVAAEYNTRASGKSSGAPHNGTCVTKWHWVRLFFVVGRIRLCGGKAGGNWSPSRRGERAAEGTGDRWELCRQRRLGGIPAGARALGGRSQYVSMRRLPAAAEDRRNWNQVSPCAGRLPIGSQTKLLAVDNASVRLAPAACPYRDDRTVTPMEPMESSSIRAPIAYGIVYDSTRSRMQSIKIYGGFMQCPRLPHRTPCIRLTAWCQTSLA